MSSLKLGLKCQKPNAPLSNRLVFTTSQTYINSIYMQYNYVVYKLIIRSQHTRFSFYRGEYACNNTGNRGKVL